MNSSCSSLSKNKNNNSNNFADKMEREITEKSLRGYIEILQSVVEKIKKPEDRDPFTEEIVKNAMESHSKIMKKLMKRKNDSMSSEIAEKIIKIDDDDEPVVSATAESSAPPNEVENTEKSLFDVHREWARVENAPQRFTLIGHHFGHSYQSDLGKIANLLTDLGIATEPHEVAIPSEQNHRMFSNCGQTRITFQVSQARTASILQMFENGECDLEHFNRNSYNKEIKLFKELSEWEVIQREAISLSQQILADIYNPAEGYVFSSVKKLSMTIQKDGETMTIYLDMLIFHFPDVFKKVLMKVNEVAKKELQQYAERRIQHHQNK